jgi:hypothetical protein
MHLMVRIHDPALRKAVRAIPEFLDAAPYYLRRPPSNAFLVGFASASDRIIRDLARRIASV